MYKECAFKKKVSLRIFIKKSFILCNNFFYKKSPTLRYSTRTTSNQCNNKEGVDDYDLRRWLMLNRYKYLTICLITCSSSSSSETGLHDDGNPINAIILFLPQPQRVPIHPQDQTATAKTTKTATATSKGILPFFS